MTYSDLIDNLNAQLDARNARRSSLLATSSVAFVANERAIAELEGAVDAALCEASYVGLDAQVSA